MAAIQAAQIAPEIPGALWNAALLSERAVDAVAAERYLIRALDAWPEHAEARYRLGFIRLQRGDFQAATELFEQCVAGRANWVGALLNLGLAHWKCERLDLAAQAYSRVLLYDQTNLEALRALAAIEVERKDANASWLYLQRIPPGAERPAELCFNLGLLYVESGNLSRAADCYELALSENPDCIPALINLGHVLQAVGRGADARESWDKARKFEAAAA